MQVISYYGEFVKYYTVEKNLIQDIKCVCKEKSQRKKGNSVYSQVLSYKHIFYYLLINDSVSLQL